MPRRPDIEQQATEEPVREEQARVFFALWPDDRVRRELARAAEVLHKSCGGRVIRREGLHATVLFLGEVPVERLESLISAAAHVDASRFSVKLATPGYWKRSRVACLTPEEVPQALLELVKSLRKTVKQADLRLDPRPFKLHLTLLRHANPCDPPPELPHTIDWPVKHFVLVRSHLSAEGSHYEIIGRWPLK